MLADRMCTEGRPTQRALPAGQINKNKIQKRVEQLLTERETGSRVTPGTGGGNAASQTHTGHIQIVSRTYVLIVHIARTKRYLTERRTA